MNNEFVMQEGLSKKERKKMKREFYRGQMNKQLFMGKIKKYTVIGIIITFALMSGYWLINEASKPLPGEFVPSLGNKHIQNITDSHDPYNSVPPTSGTHLGGKAQWGVSDSPIPDELQLHNLEDGGIMVQYNCTPSANLQNETTLSAEVQDECNQLVKNLTSKVKKYSDKVTMAPYPKLDSKIALTAWTRIDKFNDFDAQRIEKFINAFRGIDHH